MSNIKDIENNILANIFKTNSSEGLQKIKISELGKKGRITLLMKSLSKATNDEKKVLGKSYNELRINVLKAFELKEQEIKDVNIINRIKNEKLDVTLSIRPGENNDEGKIHPISRTIDSIIDIFANDNFTVETGPHIENDFNNFTALNIPDDHPARQDHDTFYIKDRNNIERKLLRTHTSPVQIRTMVNQNPPIRIIAPGRTFRCDDDATHSPMFHQIEGLVIDKNINMGHLKGLIKSFCEEFFEVSNLPVRFRPSYFPFTEPSAEIDIGYNKKGNTIKIGEGSDWLEVMGCGMVHPKVLINCGLDPKEWQGFAFGLGVERFAMLKHGISDLRNFYEGDIRWLDHYGFNLIGGPSNTWLNFKED
ncbi:MAG: Phenylalanine--tRNA ligase alpha subunit [Alphaproteobacteria bacterium MarineAlpha9_Bin3]|nr:MAG: Phenylalanine--tRNA ligase alpha subunit [Alphaproteobacteria bacterium MarineAlpha9_Bin3]|tara:strand:+ start:4254 stop:5345 length:1092 start_codon:yes stop_codon:yes gene_type:complete